MLTEKFYAVIVTIEEVEVDGEELLGASESMIGPFDLYQQAVDQIETQSEVDDNFLHGRVEKVYVRTEV